MSDFKQTRDELRAKRLAEISGAQPPAVTEPVTPILPPPPPPVVASRNGQGPTAQPELTESPARIGARLTIAVGQIANQVTNSTLRTLVTQYIRLVSPHFATDGDSILPRGFHPHAVHKERSSESAYGSVLTFHITRAVLGYYAIEMGTWTQADLDAIKFVHDLASVGVAGYTVVGGDRLGYKLVPTPNPKL